MSEQRSGRGTRSGKWTRSNSVDSLASSVDSSGGGAPLVSPGAKKHDPRTEEDSPPSPHPGGPSGGPSDKPTRTSEAARASQATGLSLLPAPAVVGGGSGAAAASNTHGRGSASGATTQAFINAMQAMTFNPQDDYLHPAHKTLRDQTCRLQTRIWGLRQGMSRQPSISEDFLTSFDYDIQEMINNTVKINQAADVLANDLRKAQLECERLQVDLNTQQAENEQLCNRADTEIRDLKREIKSLKEQRQTFESMVTSLQGQEENYKNTIRLLYERIEQQAKTNQQLEEQVAGKRSLWLKIHRDPEEQTAAINTLTHGSAPLAAGPMFAMPAGQDQAQLTLRSHSMAHPGQFQHKLPMSSSAFTSGQHQRPMSSSASTSSGTSGGEYNNKFAGHTPYYPPKPAATRPISTVRPMFNPWGNIGDRSRPTTGPTTGALVPASYEHIDGKPWADEFQALFSQVSGFCANYFRYLPDFEGDLKTRLQSEANGKIWEYMVNVCYPGLEHERAVRALFFAQDDMTRPYFLQRLIIQHMLLFMFEPEGWQDYSVDVDQELAKLSERLRTTDASNPAARQEIIDRRVELVTEMSKGPKSLQFKNHKINYHHQQLKLMVAFFLPRDKKANLPDEAYYDLFAIVSSAWELSSKVLRSRLTFQFLWHDGNAKFVADVHEALNSDLGGRALQQAQYRLKLSVTPAITIRSDQNMTIATKQILKSRVLVMH
ncbi:hypothetical protein VTK56DRAFT_7976 [Thermocarpiscus australiensis]